MAVRLLPLLVYGPAEIRAIDESVAKRVEAVLYPPGRRFLFIQGSVEDDDGATILKPEWVKDRGRWKMIDPGPETGGPSLPIAISDVTSLQPALDTLQAEIDSLVGGGGSGESFTAENKDSVTIKAGQPVAIHSSGVGIVRANATAPGKEAEGIATVDIAVGVSGIILLDGPLTLADWTQAIGASTLAARATYFLDTTAGKLSAGRPVVLGNVLQVCGKEISPTTLEIRIRNPILL